jgi:HD-GYP domain-containing protein (c-di-GMP phosphodiesterase class II)
MAMKKNSWELFHRLLDNEEYKEFRQNYLQLFGKKTKWSEMDIAPKTEAQICEKITSLSLKTSKKLIKECRNALEKVKETKKTQYRKVSSNSSIIISPLLSENSIFGYIFVVNITENLSSSHLKIFDSYLNTIVLKIQDDIELARLYDTIQPRTAALSTIHTIHRLISSTLSEKELLPRLARLTLQVMRVKRCTIYLTDRNRKFMKVAVCVTPKGVVADKRKIAIGEDIVGRSAKSAIPVLTENTLAMPLIEEDVLGVIEVTDKIDHRPFTYFDQEILTTFSEQAVIALKNANLNKQRENIAEGSIKSLKELSGTKKQPHIPEAQYKKLVNFIAKDLKVSRKDINTLNYAIKLKDVGKVSIPDKILQKNSRLTREELKTMKQHPSKSAAMLKPIKVLEPVIPLIRYQREKYDGTGYPKGLKGSQIPVGSRILSVVDAFEAMITDRPYRNAKSIDEAVDEINRNSGTQFDPKVVKAFNKIIKKSHKLKEKISKR